ncbi:MAG: LLM class flavin-dependent oxidoreductase, partial [Verrucomicrobiaceae bacterium]
LYTRPEEPPLLIGAAVTEKTAEWLGSWADGMVTTSRPRKEAVKILDAFRRGGGEGKPVFLKVGMSYGRSDEIARQNAYEQWRAVAFSNPVLTELHIPSQFDEIGKYVRPEDLDQSLRISGDVERHIAWLQEDIELGFEEIYLHNVGTNQEEFIDVAGSRILPALKKTL